MRWTAHEFSDEMKGILLINKAENWNEFLTGVKEFTVPGQNFVYADKEGNIGYVCAARLPIRANLSPTLIFDGTTSDNDWKGFVPFEEMPKLYNPPQNFIASANNKTIRNYKYHISNIWEPPSRIERIDEFLTSKEKFSEDDFTKLQNDFISHYAMDITPYILKAFRNVKVEDENLKTALELLEKWNFEMDARSQTPTIYNVFLVELLKNIFVDEMGEELFNEYSFLTNMPYRTLVELFEKGYSSWFDDVSTEEVETKDDIIRLSLVDALEFLEDKFGKNLALWQWGELHQVIFRHFFTDVNPVVDELVNIGPFAIGGDGTTVFNTEYSLSEPYENKLGPSMRFIYDFSKPDEFMYVLPTGQSGHIMSNHYSDMTSKWLTGKYIKIKTDMNSIQKSKYSFTIIKK
jgi:penicillin amidase